MASAPDGTWDERLAARFGPWARRVRLTGKLAIALAVASGICGVATYTAWTGSAPLPPNPEVVLVLLVLDLVLLTSLGALIARQLVRLWVERRSGSAGSRLHTRFVALFSLVAVAPAIVVAVFSATFFYLGIQSWFSDRVGTAVEESLAVAEAYVAEHRSTIGADILAMANDLNLEAPRLATSRNLFNYRLSTQAALRSLSEATVFDSSGRVLARTALSLSAAFNELPLNHIENLPPGTVRILEDDEEDDQVRALVRLDRFLDAYLYVARFVDPVVVNHVERTRQVVNEYKTLKGLRSDIQLTSALAFIVVALLLLLVAVWLGLTFANRLVGPIRNLVHTAEQVRHGDLSARVDEGEREDEIGTLSRAFNRMTSQLENQRSELIEANRQMDRRRRFTEAVLSGVSAGVIGLDANGIVTLPNRSAARLLETNVENLIGASFVLVLPEMAVLLEKARERPDKVVQGQVSLVRNARRRTFMVRVSGDRTRGDRHGFVVTFDDVTELVTAQRTAAWADVARRIAHEIKNPLTPIQLSAERLKRKYLKQIVEDVDVFTLCTDTIIRQVGDIRRMVDEFSAFARMPTAVMKTENLSDLIREAVFPEQFAHGDVSYTVELPEQPVLVECDKQRIGQVMTNLLQNAVEAIAAREQDGPETLPPGQVTARLRLADGRALVEIEDNGRGLPVEGREILTEPYVTTREKGTGLGLAIVRKIVEEHGGILSLDDGSEGGACVRFDLETVSGDVMTAPADPADDDAGNERAGRRQEAVSHGD